MGHNVDVPAKWLKKINPNDNKTPDKTTVPDLEEI
jgi:hypothetical protein